MKYATIRAAYLLILVRFKVELATDNEAVIIAMRNAITAIYRPLVLYGVRQKRSSKKLSHEFHFSKNTVLIAELSKSERRGKYRDFRTNSGLFCQNA